MDNSQPKSRDYSAISPSAKALVLLKGLTNIPFAKETAELISFPGKYNPNLDNKDLAFWKRVVHFEIRYWSIDQLLTHLAINNIIELSSGYSFRGLHAVLKRAVHYIDTDLSNVIEQKKEFISAIQENDTRLGKLEMVALNALDQEEFIKIVGSFPPGPVAIVNEGLLMYLDNEEKEKLCRIIYRILKQHGGFWITGDVYVKSTLEKLRDTADDSLHEVVEQQRIEANMFDSFDAARDFFSRQGFVIDKEAELDLSSISSLKYLIANATEVQLAEMQTHPKIQASWRLRIATDA